jgi:hypothetical protein
MYIYMYTYVYMMVMRLAQWYYANKIQSAKQDSVPPHIFNCLYVHIYIYIYIAHYSFMCVCIYMGTTQGPWNLNPKSMYEGLVNFGRHVLTKWLQARIEGSKNRRGIAFEGPGVELQSKPGYLTSVSVKDKLTNLWGR